MKYIHTIKKIRQMLGIAGLVGLSLYSPIFTACSKGDAEPGSAKVQSLSVAKDTVDFKNEASNQNVTITATSEDWKAQSDQSWCRATAMKRYVRIDVDKNEDLKVREANVSIISGGTTKTIRVRQIGIEPTILVTPSSFEVAAGGAKIDFTVTTNVAFDIKLPDWITINEARSAELVTTEHHYVVKANSAAAARIGQIEVVEKDATKADLKRVFITVNQSGLGKYTPTNADDIKSDVKIKVVGGTDTSHQGADGIAKSFDGDMNTLYHSAWANGGSNYFPITLTYELDGVQDVDYIVYHPRQQGYNGYFKVVDIEYSTDGTTYTRLMTKDFDAASTAVRVIPNAPFKARYVRFIVRSGHGDGQGFASCAEMEFYKKNAESFDARTLFADDLCTTLRSGVTEADITKCEFPFFKNLAYQMYHNQYNREFRVNTFEPYLHPNVRKQANKNQYAYSLLDNPTGISVAEGENLVVFVGDTHGYDGLAIRVQNLDKPGGDGFYDAQTYALHQGINKIKINKKGLVYVMYHANSEAKLSQCKPIKMHFASGQVNGYYDSQDASLKDRWTELIGKATDPYFDVVGRYAHLTMPTQRFRNQTKDAKALIDTYDKIVYNEMMLHGLYKYNRVQKNRMYLSVMYQSYMYATSYHTAYNNTTLDGLLDAENLKNGVWGPAHEIGHMNQTPPGILWRGMTEVTVNIPSLYIQTTIFNKPSRVQTEDMGGGTNRYTKAWNSMILSKKPFCYGGGNAGSGGDVFCQLIPFWQLELYFGKVLGRSANLQADHGGFYPDLHEYMRVNPDVRGAGNQQTEFAYAVSKVAGYDLTDFFEKWGFFVPVDQEINDYSKEQLTITEERVTEVKARIKALGLPKLNLPIEYITDNNYTVFKSKQPIVAGSASRTDNTITLTNWQNVVVYEVYNAAGQVVYVTDGQLAASTTHRIKLSGGWQAGYSVKAVAYNGNRVAVNL